MDKLRSLEVEAYMQLVSTFRAQGPLTPEKCGFLREACRFLGITTEMHKTEVRRAMNDEMLSAIAYKVTGLSETTAEWNSEGCISDPFLNAATLTTTTITTQMPQSSYIARTSTLPTYQSTKPYVASTSVTFSCRGQGALKSSAIKKNKPPAAATITGLSKQNCGIGKRRPKLSVVKGPLINIFPTAPVGKMVGHIQEFVGSCSQVSSTTMTALTQRSPNCSNWMKTTCSSETYGSTRGMAEAKSQGSRRPSNRKMIVSQKDVDDNITVHGDGELKNSIAKLVID